MELFWVNSALKLSYYAHASQMKPHCGSLHVKRKREKLVKDFHEAILKR